MALRLFMCQAGIVTIQIDLSSYNERRPIVEKSCDYRHSVGKFHSQIELLWYTDSRRNDALPSKQLSVGNDYNVAISQRLLEIVCREDSVSQLCCFSSDMEYPTRQSVTMPSSVTGGDLYQKLPKLRLVRTPVPVSNLGAEILYVKARRRDPRLRRRSVLLGHRFWYHYMVSSVV